MPYRKNEFYPGLYYHVYNRGANRQRIFFNKENYLYCLRQIKKYSKEYFISVITYCLMPNHYHFILRQDADKNISDFIGVLFNSYVQAVNKQQNRSGTLFEGRFRNIHIDKDEYLKHLCRYIHLNPVEANLVKTPDKWLFSNYIDWIGNREGTLVDRNFIACHFKNSKEYKQFVLEYQLSKQLKQKLERYLFD